MTKIRFYKVNLKDGNQTWNEVVPAHSRGNAEAYFNNPHIKAAAEFIGFHEVNFSYNGEITFHTDVRDYYGDSIGYNYLYSHLRVSIDKFINDLQNQAM
jgi:hypothetical protein